MTHAEQDPEPDTRQPGLAIRNARLAWGDTMLMDGVSFSVRAGGWTCLLGESGVGKSTLLRTIAGLVAPIAPTEIVANGSSEFENQIAYMAQQDLLFPWLTAAQNVAAGARLRSEPVDDRRVHEILDRAGVAGRADARPAEMSGGERQRVALARTLMEERPIVLMDEPFSALDAITRMRLQDLAIELLADRTVLMVTHDPFEALRMAEKIHVLRRDGEVRATLVEPAGPPPRDPTDPALRETHGAIMTALGGAPAANRGPA